MIAINELNVVNFVGFKYTIPKLIKKFVMIKSIIITKFIINNKLKNFPLWIYSLSENNIRKSTIIRTNKNNIEIAPTYINIINNPTKYRRKTKNILPRDKNNNIKNNTENIGLRDNMQQ